MDTITSIVQLTLRLTAPYLLLTLGGLFAFKTNIFNLSLDGFGIFGCFISVTGAFYTGSVFMGVIFAVLSTSLLALLYAVFVLELKVEPIVCSLAFIAICGGLTRFLLEPVLGAKGRFLMDSAYALRQVNVPFLEKIPYVGPLFNNQTPLVYIALLSVVLIHILLYRTKFGFQLRMVGLNEEAAVASGINIKGVRYICLLLNGMFCGLAGAQMALPLNMFNVGMTDGRGFTAVVILMLSDSRPIPAFLASLMFGFSESMVLRLSGYGFSSQILGMLPYVMAFIFAILPFALKITRLHIKRRNAKRNYMIPAGKPPEDIKEMSINEHNEERKKK